MINFSDYSPILHEEGNYTQSTNGDQVIGYQVSLPEFLSLSPKQFDEIHSLWYQALKDLPPCIFLKQDFYIKKKFSGNKMPTSTFLEKAAKKNVVGKDYVSHSCNIFFINAGNRYLKSNSVSNPFKKPPTEKEYQEQAKKDQLFADQIEQTVGFLKQSPHFAVQPLPEGYTTKMAKLYFNGFHSDRITDTIRNGTRMTIGEKHVGTFAINSTKQFSQTISNHIVDSKSSGGDFEFHRGLFDAFGLELNFDHVYSQILFIEDHHTLKKEIDERRKQFHNWRQFSPESKQADDELSEYMREIAKDEKIRLIRAHFNITFFAENESQYKHHISQISGLFKELDITPYQPVGNEQANVYYHSFPTNASGLNKQNTYITDLQQALCLFSNTSGFKQDQEGVFFSDRIFNLPLRNDIWDAKKRYIKARNFFIVAPTGEGKSVLANTILSQLLDQGYYVVINDLGGSYEKLALLYPDITVYLQYEEGKPLGINPFYMGKGEQPGANKLNQLAEFVRVLYKRDAAYEEPELVSVRKLLKQYYATVEENHSFPSFYKFIKYLHTENLLDELEIAQQHFDAPTFIHVCSEFVDDGTYAFLLPEDAKELDIDLTGKRLVINEFDKAQGDPLLVSILLNLSNAIDQKLIWEDKSKRGFIFYDECAKQLKFPNVLTTIEWKFQAIRKQEGGIGVVLQSANQLPVDPKLVSASESILANTQMYFILNNTNGYDAEVKRFNFSEHEHMLLKSITNNFSADAPIKYSEFMFRRARKSKICRLHLAEEVRCAYLTEGHEHLEIMKFYNDSNNMEIAIDQYIKSKE